MGWAQRGSFSLDLIAYILLFALVVIAATGDVKERRISNRLNGSIVLCWLLVEITAVVFFEEICQIPLQAIGWSFILLVTGLLLFAFNLLGGGDVKMLAAVGLWLPPASSDFLISDQVISFLAVTTVLGGVLSLVVLVYGKIVTGADRRVPYGMAVGLGALWVCLQPLAGVVE